jgi:hypothetical protein
MLYGFPIPAVYRVAPEYVRSLSEREAVQNRLLENQKSDENTSPTSGKGV